MAINSTRLTTRLGKLVGGLNELNVWQGTDLPARFDTIDNQYETATQDIVDGLYEQLANAQGNDALIADYYQSLAVETIKREVNLDRPGLGNNLQSAMTEWIRQLNVAGETLEESPVTVVTTPVLTTGDGELYILATGDLVSPDSIVTTVTVDVSRGATEFQETLSLQGNSSVSPATSWLWPTGGDAVTSFSAVDGAQDVGLTNGSLLGWDVADLSPTGWTNPGVADDPSRITTATTGIRGSDGPYGQYVGTGAAGVHGIYQDVEGLLPNTYYGVSMWLRASAGMAAGSIAAALGAVNAFTIAASSVPSVWTLYTVIIKTGDITTGPTYGRFAFVTTLMTLAETLDFGFFSIQPLSQIGNSGLYAYAVSGETAFTVDDYWTTAITMASGGPEDSLVRGIDRFIGLRGSGLIIPTDGTPTYSDALVS